MSGTKPRACHDFFATMIYSFLHALICPGVPMKVVTPPSSGNAFPELPPNVVIVGDRMEITQTQRLQIIAGWIFALLGPALITTGTYFLYTRNFQSEFIPLIIMGTLITFTGILCINVRSRIVIDRGSRKVEKHSGFRRTAIQDAWDFDQIREIRVKRYTSRGSEGGGGGTPWFGITLERKQGQPEMLMRFDKPVPARRMAEEIARFMDKPLRNSLNHADSVRQPHQLDWPLSRLLHERGETIPFPERPRNSVVEVNRQGSTLFLKIPAPGFMRGGILWAFLIEPLIIGPLFFAAGFVGAASNPAFLKFLFAVAAIPLAALTLWSLYRGSERIELTLDPHHMQLRFSSLFRQTTLDLPAHRIEELTWFDWPPSALGLVRTGGLAIHTDDQIVTFGSWLSRDNQQFLYNAICHVLSQAPTNNRF